MGNKHEKKKEKKRFVCQSCPNDAEMVQRINECFEKIRLGVFVGIIVLLL